MTRVRPRHRQDYRRPNKGLHDRCLQACWEHEAELSEPELLVLNRVAGNFAAGEDVHRDDCAEALRILGRLDR